MLPNKRHDSTDFGFFIIGVLIMFGVIAAKIVKLCGQTKLFYVNNKRIV